jgi:5-methylcytosine-specific restriction enzyme A
MNRKQFIESQGATCRNWNWSWSFINEKEKIIIFGAWDVNTEGNSSLIFSEDWEILDGRKQPGYQQSREHIRLIEEERFHLKTFRMKFSDEKQNEDGSGPAKIGSFEPILISKSLIKIGKNWYASDKELNNTLPEEVVSPEHYFEGATKKVSINTYERNAEARAKCLRHHGYVCVVCTFGFKSFYGEIGENYIHVHHIVPLSEIKKEYCLDPIKDLVPVCPNCHAIIHRTQPPLTIEQLKQY